MLDIVFQPHGNVNDGVLVGEENPEGVEPLLMPHKLYTSRDYRLIGALIFHDPVGSSVQDVHEDVSGCDRDAVWNIVFPLMMDGMAKPAASEFSSTGGCAMTLEEATMWDGCWPHRGLGNQSGVERVYLHMVFAPYWMVIPDGTSKTLNGLQERHKTILTKLSLTDNDPWPFVNQIQYGKGGLHGISQEYNNSIPLWAEDSPMLNWIKRVQDNYAKSGTSQ